MLRRSLLQLGPLAATTGWQIAKREPAAFGGLFEIALLTPQ
jgi:hypothetical protein